MKRLTVIPWSCHQTGDCCRTIDQVLMTADEALLIRQSITPAKWETLVWAPGPASTTGTFVKLQAFPCPLLDDDGKCSVYEVRPYNCRRFSCLRPSPDEPFEPDHSKFGCANATDRVTSNRDARRFMERFQRKAMRWAVAHGWRA